MVDSESPLWTHQRDAIQAAAELDHYALFFDPGTGKTRTVLEIFAALCVRRNAIPATLILAPDIVVSNIKREIETYLHPCYSRVTAILRGTAQQRRKTLKTRTDCRVFITNHDTLNSEFGDDLLRAPWAVLIVDESHRFKNPTAKRTKKLLKIAQKAEYRFILSGTPVLNTPLDLHSQMKILTPQYNQILPPNYYEFRAKYFEDKNAAFRGRASWFPKWTIRPGALEELSAVIAPHCARATKSECLDLPPFVRQVVYVDLTPEQAEHYEAMQRDFITFLEAA